MRDHSSLDHELAALTDRLLAGEPVEAPEELADLVPVVRQLQQATRRPPDPAFKARLDGVLDREWRAAHARRPAALHRWNRRAVRLRALAAALAVLVMAVVLLALAGTDQRAGVEGTASGSIPWTVALAAVLVGVAAIGVYLWRSRRP